MPPFKTNNKGFIKNHVTGLKDLHGFDISKYKLGSRKDQILRNAVNPEAGLAILEAARLHDKRNEVTSERLAQGELAL